MSVGVMKLGKKNSSIDLVSIVGKRETRRV